MNPFPLMIDSGAFSVWKQGVTIDLNAYIAFCLDLLDRHPYVVCVNLDVINDGAASYRNWKIMREAGVPALPVYHPASDEKWLRLYLRETDHVGLGGLVGKPRNRLRPYLDRVWTTYLTTAIKGSTTRMPTAKVHGMGLTSFQLMTRYPWHSVDSTSWIRTGMYGNVLQPRRRNGAWDYSAPPILVAFSDRSPGLKVRGDHYENMSPTERAVLLRYLDERGFWLGFSASMPGSTDRAELMGVSTWCWPRMQLCLEFYASFIGLLPWPRPLAPRAPHLLARARQHIDSKKRTIFYTSGSGWEPESYVRQHRDRMPHVGFLFSYYELATRASGGETKRLNDVLTEGEA